MVALIVLKTLRSSWMSWITNDHFDLRFCEGVRQRFWDSAGPKLLWMGGCDLAFFVVIKHE